MNDTWSKRRYGRLALETQEIILKKRLFGELEKQFSVIGIVEESECGDYIKVAVFTPMPPVHNVTPTQLNP